MRKILSVVVGVIVIMSGFVLWAKSPDERINDLEKQLADLQRTYMTNNQDAASAVSRMETIRDEFNTVKGEAEAASHQLKTQREELMRLISDLQARVQAIEERMGTFSTQVSSALGKVSPAAASEAEAYQKGMDLANASQYLEAAAAFEAFLQKYPKSQYAAGARRWVGECFYSSRDYRRAIKEYQNYIEKYPKDAKVPDAILKQGNSFYELGMLDEAQAFYQKVISAYSGSTEAKQAKAKLTRIEERKAGGKGAGAPPGSAPAAYSGTGSSGGMGGYPTETIEQQRQKMGGVPASSPPPKEKRPETPARGF